MPLEKLDTAELRLWYGHCAVAGWSSPIFAPQIEGHAHLLSCARSASRSLARRWMEGPR